MNEGAVAVCQQESSLVRPVTSATDLTKALSDYKAMQEALDIAMPDCIQTIAGKQFRKKNYWRAVKTAFNLRVECVMETRQSYINPEDWGYEVTYRATAPNGASADGDGACTFSEKNKGSMAATVHNIRSQAHTRAFNRAVSNLVGFGEVSAEEIHDDDKGQSQKQTEHHQPSGGGAVISDAQAKRFYAIAKSAGWEDAELKEWLKENYQIDSTKKILKSQYENMTLEVQAGPNG